MSIFTITIDSTTPPVVTIKSNSLFGMNVGNDQNGSQPYDAIKNSGDALVLDKNLASKRVRIALPSYNNPQGISNMRQLAVMYKKLGYFVSYGVTGLSSPNSATSYAAWKAQVPVEAKWASDNKIDRFFIGNEEDWQAQIGAFGTTITGDIVRNDVRSLSKTLKLAYPQMEIVYSTAEGCVSQWGAFNKDFGALDKLGFNMYNTLGGFDAGLTYFQQQIGSKLFLSEWAANYPYYDMTHGKGENDVTYAADLRTRRDIIEAHGLEAYFFALRYGDNKPVAGNWNIYTDQNVLLPGSKSAFGQ